MSKSLVEENRELKQQIKALKDQVSHVGCSFAFLL